MSTYNFTVHEGVALTEKISVDTTGATSATFTSASSLEGTFATPSGVTVTVGSGFVTVDIPAGSATSANFPAYYYIDLDNAPQAISGRAWFSATPVSDSPSADSVPISTTGLTVVSGATVQEAVASLDTWATGHPVANPPGTLANRPANGAQPDGSTYYATDDNGGQNYAMVGGVWTKRGPAVGDASGRSLAYQELAANWGSGNYAAGNPDLDVTGLSVAFSSGVRPFRAEYNGVYQFGLGTAASPQVIRAQTKIQQSTDGGTTWTSVALFTAAAKVLTGEAHYVTVAGKSGLITPPANATAYSFKITVAVNITGATITAFGRGVGTTTSLEVVER